MTGRIRDLPTSFDEAMQALDGKGRREVCRETWLVKGDNSVDVVHHSTVIATFSPSEDTFTTGGYATTSTNRRLNVLSPRGISFYREGGIGMVRLSSGEEQFSRTHAAKVLHTIRYETGQTPQLHDIRMIVSLEEDN